VAFATKRPLQRRAYAEATISGLEKLSRRFSKGERELRKGVVERRTSTESETFIPLNIYFDATNFALSCAFTVIGTICAKNWAKPQITFC